jgi:AcrR family transcriptional regulator
MDDRAESKQPASVRVETGTIPKRRRLGREQRRRQLVEAAVRLIGSLGIQGTTVSKISAHVGLSEMAAYRHFGNKDEILMEASSYLLGRIFAWPDSSANPCILERFGELGQSHFDMLSSDLDMFTGAYIQFLTMTRGDDPLHDRIAEDVHCLTDLRNGTFARSSHLRMLELILRDVAAPGFGEGKGQARG